MGARMLEGRLVRLRGLREEDLEVVARHYDDPEVLRYLAFWDRPQTAGDLRAWYDRVTASSDPTMAIADLRDDSFLGAVGLHLVDARARRAGIGIAIWEPDGRGRGCGTEAMELVCELAFAYRNMHRVELTVLAGNARAIRVYEKAGFVVEGRLREAFYWDGRYDDLVCMGLLRSQWEARRRPEPGDAQRG